VERRTPGDLNAQITELLSGLTADLSVWRDLTRRYRGDLFCGLFMDEGKEGVELTPSTLAAMGARGLLLDLDIYEPARHERRLFRHPGSVGSERLGVDASITRTHSGRLAVSFTLSGVVGDVLMPAEEPSGRADGLWRSTCFEVFIAAEGEGYLEFNLAPTTQWAAYRFDGYRAGMRPLEVADPAISSYSTPDRVELWAELRIDEVAELEGRPWRVGVSAVIEDTAGAISYWALTHPGDKPDFHHPRFLRPRASRTRMNFGIDRLLADPALRAPLEGKRVALLAHPASVTADLTHSLDALKAVGRPAGDRGVRASARDAGGQAGQHGGDRGLHRPAARDSGVQPLWPGAAAVGAVDGDVRRAAGRHAGPGVPDLHLHHDAAVRAGGGGGSTARRCGCWTGPTRRGGRWRG
jgi:hypothetical protein